MARPRESAVETFLKQSQNAQQQLPETPDVYGDIVKNTQKAQQQQVQQTQQKAQDVSQGTTKEAIKTSSGLSYDTSSYDPAVQNAVQKEVDTTTKPVIDTSGDLNKATSFADFNTSIQPYIENLNTVKNTAVQNLETVNQEFLAKGIDAAKQKYKDVFGEDMPADVAGNFGDKYQTILDYLKAPKASLGLQRQMSQPEIEAVKALNTPEEAISHLYGQGDINALDVQSSYPQLAQMQQQNAAQQQSAQQIESQRQQSIKDYLAAQAQGTTNLSDVEKESQTNESVAEKNQNGLVNDIQFKLNEKNSSQIADIVTDLGKKIEALSQGDVINDADQSQIDNFEKLIENNKDKLSKNGYSKLTGLISDAKARHEKQVVKTAPITPAMSPLTTPENMPPDMSNIQGLGNFNMNGGGYSIPGLTTAVPTDQLGALSGFGSPIKNMLFGYI